MNSPAGLQDLDWLSDHDPEALPEDFRLTPAFKLIVDRVKYAQAVQAPIVLVTGAHGAGKTTTLRWIASTTGALYWECKPRYKPHHVLTDLAMRLGINAGTGWNVMTHIVVEHMAAEPRLVILDEAQRLDYDGMDLLKFIADQTGSTFVISASPSLETRVNRWPDIASRTSVRIRVATLSLEDVQDIFKDEGFSAETLAEFHKLTGGVLRSLRALFRDVDDHLASSLNRGATGLDRGDVLPQHVRAIAEKVL